MKIKTLSILLGIGIIGLVVNFSQIIPVDALIANASIRTFEDYDAIPPIHTLAGSGVTTTPKGMSPTQIKTAYLLPGTGGSGTIVIISAYEHPLLESDLAVFDKQFSIASCTIANSCLSIHSMKATASSSTKTPTNAGWDLESALDSQWAHAIAPKAKILIVEAASSKGADLMKAIDYARTQKGVISVSMSWGGNEFSDELKLDSHFSSSTIAFFASSGDDGMGASWPAASPYVIGVGGTTLTMTNTGSTAKFSGEKAWSGSGGGVSLYEPQPQYQKTYSIPRSNGMRAIPDVSYAADPQHGYSVYHNGWYVIGGTSAGAPQWAALAALGNSSTKKYPLTLSEIYKDKAKTTYALFFRDITSGTNGTCGYYCAARSHYDYVTGLGSPLTYHF